MSNIIIVIHYRVKYQYGRMEHESTAEMNSLLLDSSN